MHLYINLGLNETTVILKTTPLLQGTSCSVFPGPPTLFYDGIHPNFAERGIRTFKDKLVKRIEADEKRGKENIQWADYMCEIVLTYNNKDKHSATGMTPKESAMKKTEIKVKSTIALQSVSKRKYPDLKVGDNVKIYRKKDKLVRHSVSVARHSSMSKCALQETGSLWDAQRSHWGQEVVQRHKARQSPGLLLHNIGAQVQFSAWPSLQSEKDGQRPTEAFINGIHQSSTETSTQA